MRNAINKLKLTFKKLLAWVPTPLPVGLTAFNVWVDDVIKTYGLPYNDSVRGALAVMVIHSGETTFYRSKRYFGMKLLKGATNEVAHALFMEVKNKQAAESKAASEAAKSENQQPTI